MYFYVSSQTADDISMIFCISDINKALWIEFDFGSNSEI
jgi:hypothetical protein